MACHKLSMMDYSSQSVTVVWPSIVDYRTQSITLVWPSMMDYRTQSVTVPEYNGLQNSNQLQRCGLVWWTTEDNQSQWCDRVWWTTELNQLQWCDRDRPISGEMACHKLSMMDYSSQSVTVVWPSIVDYRTQSITLVWPSMMDYRTQSVTVPEYNGLQNSNQLQRCGLVWWTTEDNQSQWCDRVWWTTELNQLQWCDRDRPISGEMACHKLNMMDYSSQSVTVVWPSIVDYRTQSITVVWPSMMDYRTQNSYTGVIAIFLSRIGSPWTQYDGLQAQSTERRCCNLKPV